jgi:hypothetical protein
MLGGAECVNPNHFGTGDDFVRAVNGRRQEIPEPSRTVMAKLTPQDRRLLKTLKIGWEISGLKRNKDSEPRSVVGVFVIVSGHDISHVAAEVEPRFTNHT